MTGYDHVNQGSGDYRNYTVFLWASVSFFFFFLKQIHIAFDFSTLTRCTNKFHEQKVKGYLKFNLKDKLPSFMICRFGQTCLAE